jgi:Holliday junction DNA helicase RuvB
VQIQLAPFTLIGATTRSGLLTAPLRARFGINSHLEYYDADVLTGIIERSAAILSTRITGEAAREIASRSRGTPRIANALLRRVRDFAMVKGNGTVDHEITRYALEALNIDKFKGGPVGLTTIATAVSEDPGTLEEVYEPFLIKEGFMQRTPRGREITDLAYKHLGKERKTREDYPTLF